MSGTVRAASADRILARWRLRHRDAATDRAALPDPDRAAGSEGLPEIRHIVVLMMENHSFDNYLGTLGHGEGLTREADGGWGPANPGPDGAPIRPHHFATTRQASGDPTQSWHASHIQYADGRLDGFPRSVVETDPGGDPTTPMGFWTEEDLPFYASLARTFALADRWHCSLLGPTFPNRRFLISGTAHGLVDDALIATFDHPQTGTLFDLLDRHGISWANYHPVSGPGSLLGRSLRRAGHRTRRAVRLGLSSALPSMLKMGKSDFQFTVDLYPTGVLRELRHLRSTERFFRDAKDGTLPAVSIVDPDFQANSEENPQDIRDGEQYAASVIEAVMHGPGWPHSLLVWLYDEHGGYFDHVPPPAAVEPDDVQPRSLLAVSGRWRWLLRRLPAWRRAVMEDSGGGRYDRLGFRVPAVVVSPYARPGYVCSTVFDHTAVLKLIERKWNLPPLTRRDAAAADLLELVDLDAAPAFLDPPALAPPGRGRSSPG